MDKKFKILVVIGGLVIIIVLAWWLWPQASVPEAADGLSENNRPAPEFMNAEEKAALQLSPATRAQVITRDGQGGISVYKIIRTDSDIVADPAGVRPLSPQAEPIQ